MYYPKGATNAVENHLWGMLWKWSENCCLHPNLYFCNERVGNWSTVRQLQQTVLEKADRFPHLAAIWPSGNDGQIDSKLAKLVLKELEIFCGQVSEQSGLFLADVNKGVDTYSYIESYDGVFFFDGKTGMNTGFDCNGLFVIDRETGEEYFRSMHFVQEELPDELSKSPDGDSYTIQPSLLTDIATGHSCRINMKHDNNAG